jgi:hypothetical protein
MQRCSGFSAEIVQDIVHGAGNCADAEVQGRCSYRATVVQW